MGTGGQIDENGSEAATHHWALGSARRSCATKPAQKMALKTAIDKTKVFSSPWNKELSLQWLLVLLVIFPFIPLFAKEEIGSG